MSYSHRHDKTTDGIDPRAPKDLFLGARASMERFNELICLESAVTGPLPESLTCSNIDKIQGDWSVAGDSFQVHQGQSSTIQLMLECNNQIHTRRQDAVEQLTWFKGSRARASSDSVAQS